MENLRHKSDEKNLSRAGIHAGPLLFEPFHRLDARRVYFLPIRVATHIFFFTREVP